MGRRGIHEESCEYSERNNGMWRCPGKQMVWSNRFPQDGFCIAQASTRTGDTHNCHHQVSHRMEWLEVRRLEVERRCEEDPLKRKNVCCTAQSSPMDATKSDRPHVARPAARRNRTDATRKPLTAGVLLPGAERHVERWIQWLFIRKKIFVDRWDCA